MPNLESIRELLIVLLKPLKKVLWPFIKDFKLMLEELFLGILLCLSPLVLLESKFMKDIIKIDVHTTNLIYTYS